MSEIKDNLVAKYNELNGSSLTENDITFRIKGVFTPVSKMSDEEAERALNGLIKAIESKDASYAPGDVVVEASEEE